MDKNWHYYGIFFDIITKNELYKKANQYLKIDIDDWKKYCDHVTIVYNDGNPEKQKLADNLQNLIGTEETIKVTHLGVSNRAIAFGVDYSTTNKISHVTVAVAPNAKPVESNYITNWKPIDTFYIKGKLDKR